MISLGNEKVQERMRKYSGKASLRAIRSEGKRRLQEREGRRWAETVKRGKSSERREFRGRVGDDSSYREKAGVAGLGIMLIPCSPPHTGHQA